LGVSSKGTGKCADAVKLVEATSTFTFRCYKPEDIFPVHWLVRGNGQGGAGMCEVGLRDIKPSRKVRKTSGKSAVFSANSEGLLYFIAWILRQ
jgi:hypothetical protein